MASTVKLSPGEMLVLEGKYAVVATKLFSKNEITAAPNGDKVLVKVGLTLDATIRPTDVSQLKVELLQGGVVKKTLTTGDMYYNSQTGQLDVWLDSANFQTSDAYVYRVTYNGKAYNAFATQNTEFNLENTIKRRKLLDNKLVYESTQYRFYNGCLSIKKTNTAA